MQNITNFNFQDLKVFNKIYCLVSGGIDSTYLFEVCKSEGLNVIPVNCFNPFEYNETIKQIQNENANFISVKPNMKKKAREYIIQAFKRISEAISDMENGKYQKKIFPCCYQFKEKAFKQASLFKENGSVVISGIKFGDGKNRRIWCCRIKKRRTFYHLHLGGQLYCYPFRDYRKRDLPIEIVEQLKQKYPKIAHTGCSLCPVLIVQDLKSEVERYARSKLFYESLKEK